MEEPPSKAICILPKKRVDTRVKQFTLLVNKFKLYFDGFWHDGKRFMFTLGTPLEG